MVWANDKRTSIPPLFARLADGDDLALIQRCRASRRQYVAPALGRMQCRLADLFNTLLRTGTNVMSCARDARVVAKAGTAR